MPNNYHNVEKIVTLDNLILKALFKDGTVKIYDMKPIVYGNGATGTKSCFSLLIEKPETFRNAYVSLDGGLIIWDRNTDLSTEAIWYDGTTLSNSDWTTEDDIASAPCPIMFYVDKTENMVDYVDLFLFPTDNEHIIPYLDAYYNNCAASYAVTTGECLEGRLPEEADVPFHQWLEQNRGEVLRVWKEKQNLEKYHPRKVPARAVR